MSSDLPALARMFSSTVVKELAQGCSPTLARLVRQSESLIVSSTDRVFDLFENAFTKLRLGHERHEYIFKAAITKRILLGTHSLNTASMLSEFRVGQCKADLVILNGTAAAFEIKSERDTLARLQKQVEAYRRVFASVNVVAGEGHILEMERSLPSDVGIYRLSRGLNISAVRACTQDLERLNSTSIFECLNSKEAALVLQELGVDVPAVPNTRLRREMKTCFDVIPADQLHHAMVRVLKRTRSLASLSEFVEALPPSIYPLAFSIRMTGSERKTLIQSIGIPAAEAAMWG